MILQCPSCNANVEAPDGMAGGLMTCGKCQAEFKVPERASSAPEAKPPAAPEADAERMRRLAASKGISFAPPAAPGPAGEPPATEPAAPGPAAPKPGFGAMPEDQAERMRQLAASKGVGFGDTPAGPTTPLPANAALPPAPPVPDWTQVQTPKLETEGSPLDRFGMRLGGPPEPADPNATPAFATGTPDQTRANAGELARQQAEDAAAEAAAAKATADREQAEAETEAALKRAYAGADAQKAEEEAAAGKKKQAEAMRQGAADIGNLPILRDLVQAFQPLVKAVGGAADVFRTMFGSKAGGGPQEGGGGKGGPKGGEAGGKEGEGGKGMAEAGGSIGGAIGQALGSASIGGAVGAAMGALASVTAGLVQTFSQLTSVAAPFVAALNPSIVQQLNYVYRDLQAVIGQALVPVIQQAVASTRFLADALVEPMRALRPVVAQLMTAFGGVMDALSQTLGQTLTALTPAFGALAGVADLVGVTLRVCVSALQAVVSVLSPFIGVISGVLSAVMVPLKGLGEMFAEMMRAVAAVAAGVGALVNSLIKGLGGLMGGIGGTLVSFGDGLRGVVQGLVKLGLVLTAAVAKFFNAGSFIEGMIKSLEGPKSGESTGMGAATGGQVTGLEAWSKSLMGAAFTAQQVGPEGEKKDSMAEIIGILRGIEQGKDWTQIISDAIKNAIPGYRAAESIGSAGAGALSWVGGGFSAVNDYTLRPAGGAIGNAINWATGMPTV